MCVFVGIVGLWGEKEQKTDRYIRRYLSVFSLA